MHEHIPEIKKNIQEIKRVLKPGGLVFFAPAWQCAAWLSAGYNVRPYSQLNLKGKITKASIPVIQSIFYRGLKLLPKRIYRHFLFLMGFRQKSFLLKKLQPNYKVFWGPDSDACNSIDPHDAYLWFSQNGFQCINHPSKFTSLFIRTGPLIFRKT